MLTDLNVLLAALAVGPLGNLRHDSALMGAITKTKGKQALPERIPVSFVPVSIPFCALPQTLVEWGC